MSTSNVIIPADRPLNKLKLGIGRPWAALSSKATKMDGRTDGSMEEWIDIQTHGQVDG